MGDSNFQNNKTSFDNNIYNNDSINKKKYSVQQQPNYAGITVENAM